MNMSGWSQSLLYWGMGISVGALVAAAVAVPWVVGRLPRDYFSRPGRARWAPDSSHRIPRLLFGVARNVLGAVLVLLGLVMLLTPGQGLLTLLTGLLLMSFPGKHRLQRWLVKRRGVLGALNWLRRRRGQPPFDVPP